jgi:hypothetical protein
MDSLVNACINIFAKESSRSDWGSNPRPYGMTLKLHLTASLNRSYPKYAYTVTGTVKLTVKNHRTVKITFSIHRILAANVPRLRITFTDTGKSRTDRKNTG